MRIVHVVPRAHHPWSGVLSVITHLSAGLAAHGHEVEVWPLYDWERDHAFAGTVAILNAAGVRCVQSPLPPRWWQYGRIAERIEAGGGSGVVHLHSAFSPTNTAIARALELPYVLSPHGGYSAASLQRGRWRKRVYLALAERRMVEHAALVCVLTDVEAGEVQAAGRRGPLAVVPNGVPGTPPDTDQTAFRKSLGLENARLAVFVGRLDIRHKGLDVLVAGIADAPEWHLALIGPDQSEGRRALERQIRELGISERVHLLEPRMGRALHEALASADVFVLVSRWEGLPVSLLEALAHGIPAVVSRAVERTVPVAASGAGWVTTPGRLAETLTRVPPLDHPGRSRFAEAARRLAGRYQWSSVVRRYEAIYADVLNRART